MGLVEDIAGWLRKQMKFNGENVVSVAFYRTHVN